MSDTTDKMSGKAKQAIGHVTDNKTLEAKGKMQESKGNLKSSLRETGQTVSNKIDETLKKHE
jgi:uncharacterized protein YjbJ (UPF0337 family)